jgi:hypothetical protein
MDRLSQIKLDIGFAHFELYDDYLVGTIKEGIVFNAFHLLKFHEIFDQHYSNRAFGYISNRKYDYTIDPTAYFDVSNYSERLVGIAVLCYSKTSFNNAIFSRQFIQRPLEAFYSMDESVAWIQSLLNPYKTSESIY